MHSPKTEPRPSLYYAYRVHSPWVPSSAGGQPQSCNVAIVGAGPAGMVTALTLAQHGVRSVLLNAECQVSEGSRAIVFTRRSMEILQQVGVAHRVTESGLPWRFGNSYYRGKKVFRLEAPYDPDDRFFPMTNLQQQYLEEYLLDACAAEPLIEVRWGNKVTTVTQAQDAATLSVDTPEGLYELRADWVVAADGGRSGIRAALGLSMEGASYEGRFVIADIRIDLPLPTERLAYFDPDWNPGNTILMHREPHGIWRIDYQLPETESVEEALSYASLKTRIDAQLAMIGFAGTPWELDWSSVYSARTLTLPDYWHGRTLFVGDAAHLLPIFGVRGANTAFQDAQSLGWHLAMVAKGITPPQILADYSAERVGAAREIIDEAGKSTRFMTPPTEGFRLLRNAVLSLSLTHAFVRPLYHWRTSRPHAYADSRRNSRGDDNALFQSGPGHGEPPKNVQIGANHYLLDHLASVFTLLYFSQSSSVPKALTEVIDSHRSRGMPIIILIVSGTELESGGNPVLADVSGRIRQSYGIPADGAAYLLRPDQHVCARWLTLDADRLDAALRDALPEKS
ncbi:MAG: hypothetical protein RL258_963 [Pseudomonadota bacterium]